MICNAYPLLCGWQNQEELDGLGHVACMEDRRGLYSGLVGKPEGKRPLGINREDNIKMDL